MSIKPAFTNDLQLVPTFLSPTNLLHASDTATQHQWKAIIICSSLVLLIMTLLDPEIIFKINQNLFCQIQNKERNLMHNINL